LTPPASTAQARAYSAAERESFSGPGTSAQTIFDAGPPAAVDAGLRQPATRYACAASQSANESVK
jgi:hypothetical protein